jgi:hypothetical protein
MLTDQTQVVALPHTWTHVTTNSFIEMRKSWVKAWNETGQLTKSQYIVLREVAFKVDRELGAAYARQDRLAKHLQIGQRTVERAISKLEGLGLIEILKGNDREKKFGRMNNYRVRFDRGPTAEGWEPTPYFLSLLKPVKPAEWSDSPPNGGSASGSVAGSMAGQGRDSGGLVAGSGQANGGLIRLKTTETTDTAETEERGTTYPARQAAQDASSQDEEDQELSATDIPPAEEGSRADVESPAYTGDGLIAGRPPEWPVDPSGPIAPADAMALAHRIRHALMPPEDLKQWQREGLGLVAWWICSRVHDGMPVEIIRNMIEIYVTEERFRRLPDMQTKPWRGFLSMRELLEDEVLDRLDAYYGLDLRADDEESPNPSRTSRNRSPRRKSPRKRKRNRNSRSPPQFPNLGPTYRTGMPLCGPQGQSCSLTARTRLRDLGLPICDALAASEGPTVPEAEVDPEPAPETQPEQEVEPDAVPESVKQRIREWEAQKLASLLTESAPVAQRRTESVDEWAARLHAMLEKSKPLARPVSDPAEEDDFEELEEVEEELVA